MRYMGSKYRLVEWLHETTAALEFDTVLDAFSGSSVVSYLFKAAGKQVTSNDALNLGRVLAEALVVNGSAALGDAEMRRLSAPVERGASFIRNTFSGVFFTDRDLEFLDRVWGNLSGSRDGPKKAVALGALVRACAKRQPRGVFTVAGDPERYKDGRRDLRLSLEEHFVEGVRIFGQAAFDNGRRHRATCGDVFDIDPGGFDLVYLDPPYVPRSDDNCYVKRYHFLEGLSCYWKGLEILENTRVKKIRKPFTPFGYRRTAVDAFARMFERFGKSVLVLSYSSNGFPDLAELVRLMKRVKRRVKVVERPHRYHFGTHAGARRNAVTEYLVVGT
ncbi:MAG: DNA adenine methylase [Verrucomicrobiales bacterium]|nr:DNA adenine methylase [Verrucomicrobiales bacterium]